MIGTFSGSCFGGAGRRLFCCARRSGAQGWAGAGLTNRARRWGDLLRVVRTAAVRRGGLLQS